MSNTMEKGSTSESFFDFKCRTQYPLKLSLMIFRYEHHSVYPINSCKHGVFLTAQIKNAAPTPIFLESVKCEPVPLFAVADLNSTQDTAKNLPK
jgi:hypothetical protein